MHFIWSVQTSILLLYWAVFSSMFYWTVDVLLYNVLNVLCKWWARRQISLHRDNKVVLYCIALYCIVLYCIVVHCIALYCTLRMQTDSMTSLTPAGGFCMVFTMVMSFCFSVSRAARAASMAGIATASLASQSSCLTQKSSRTVSEMSLISEQAGIATDNLASQSPCLTQKPSRKVCEVSLAINCSPTDKLNNHMSRQAQPLI